MAGLGVPVPFAPAEVSALAKRSDVPIWYPRPMPATWLLTGLRWTETPRRRTGAVAVGVSGRGLTDGPTDIVLVAEVPGTGLGASFAGMVERDPGDAFSTGTATARIHVGNRTAGLWPVQTPTDRIAFLGEADGNWLWIIGWPDSAWGLVTDDLRLADARVDDSHSRYPNGALNPRLVHRQLQ